MSRYDRDSDGAIRLDGFTEMLVDLGLAPATEPESEKFKDHELEAGTRKDIGSSIVDP